MMASIHALLFIFAEGSGSWLNYPGFELWKFVNLGIFIAAAVYLHRVFGRPISEALKTRKDQIRAQLARAQEERDAALAQLVEVEERLQGLQDEVNAIREKTQAEARAEAERVRQATNAELEKIKESARREIETAGKVAVTELRRFASEQSIRIAEEIIRRDIGPEDELRLMRLPERQLGGTH